MAKKHFIVGVKIPDGVGTREMQEYIREAVQTWKGQKHPEDPLFDLDYKTVTVKSVRSIHAKESLSSKEE